jgi:hypothetical protein
MGGTTFQAEPNLAGLPEGTPRPQMPNSRPMVFLGDGFLVAEFAPEEEVEAAELVEALNDALKPVHDKFRRKYLADLKKVTGGGTAELKKGGK